MNRQARIEAFEARRKLFTERTAPASVALAEGRIGVEAWAELAASEIKGMYISAYIAGRGGAWSDMTFSDWGRIGNDLRGQYNYLRGFAAEIRQNPTAFSGPKIQARLELYAASARQAMSKGESARIGMPALPAHPGDGTTRCRTNCRCRWAVRVLNKARGNFNASWRLGRAEHCQTCRQRAKAWKTLRIRGGRFLDQPEIIHA